jgi:hypothetical protein
MKPRHLSIALALISLTLLDQGLTAAETPATSAPAAEQTPQDKIAQLRASLRIDRRNFLKQTMGLSEEEGNKFWSLYYQYEADLMKLNDKRIEVIKDYSTNFEKMTEAKADDLVKRSMEFRKTRSALLEKYYGKIAKATSKIVGARFLQVESVLQGAGDAEIGASLPLMQKAP